MPTTYSSSPYFDDYNETKQFYRILFRPGRAVQARELTQLQTLIQAQIERFGNGIYKEGSFVTPPKQTFDITYSYVKLQTTYNSVDADDVIEDLVGTTITGQTSGVKATVVNYTTSTTAGDPPTIFVKYTSSGTSGTASAFSDNEVITNPGSTISVRALASSATGNGTAFSVGTSVIFAKGNFLYVEEQTLIVEKYSTVTDRIIGFTVTESTVNSDDDTSLLDPAVGSFNYFAPGADRYKISLSLNDIPFSPAASDDPNFIEIVRIQDSKIIANYIDPRLSVIGDTLARRTFDESGDYVVNPFSISLFEHLRTTNVQVQAGITRDGLYTTSEGGNANLFVNIINGGKAYVRGYEVNNFLTLRVNAEKARDSANVNNGTVATQLSSYIDITGVHSLPTLSDIPTANIHNRYNAVKGTANGTKVGTARVRGIEYVSGNVENFTANYRMYLFDITMDTGYTFEKDAKQVFVDNAGYVDFTANITPTLTTLSGTVTVASGSSLVTGAGTRFDSELAVGDIITINNKDLIVNTIANSIVMTTTTNAGTTIAGASFAKNSSTVNDSDKDTYIIEFPYSTIKTVDPTNLETTYTTKRFYSRSLTAGAVSINAGTNETFAPFTTENYHVIIASGASAGNQLTLTSAMIQRSGTPTGSTLDIDLSSKGLTTETIKIITTVNKTSSAAVKKSKSLTANATIDYTSQADAQSSTLSLGKADIYRIRSIKMANSTIAFGSSYSDTDAVDITSRYTLDNGQKATYYGLGSVTLKSGQPKPVRPIRITFDYFTHGSGDYFSVDSYTDISYSNIPEVTIGTKSYKLRDCLDFRPRINDAGTGFTSTGASTTEFIDPEIDFQTDYQYYLPRTDKIAVDKDGLVFYVKGISSLNPKEPDTPDGALALFLLKQNPYVFDLVRDVQVNILNNRRYTMRDINKIENRVKNLEYYTSLSLLERDAQQAQIQDSLGFDRFKNGFLVDSFTGHGVGDAVNNQDYSVSVNYNKREASPLVKTSFVKLGEVAVNSTQRTANNYSLTGDLITLPYTDELFLDNKFSSKTENLNPFNVVTFNGVLTLDPPSDLWFDDSRVPEILSDQKNNYETLASYSLVKRDGKNIFGSINDIQQFRFGTKSDSLYPEGIATANLVDALNPSTSSIDLKGDEVVFNTSVIPKMRNVKIDFVAKGLRPNTRMYAFFDNENVSSACIPLRPETEAAIATGNTALVAAIYQFRSGIDSPSETLPFDISTPAKITSVRNYLTHLTTDEKGDLKGTFNYQSSTYNMSTGRKIFRLTNSSSNNIAAEGTFADSLFVSDGLIREIASVRPPPPPPPPPAAYYHYDSGGSSDGGGCGGLCGVYEAFFGREPDSGGFTFWTDYGAQFGIDWNNPADVSSATGIGIMQEIAYTGYANGEGGAVAAYSDPQSAAFDLASSYAGYVD